MPSDQSPSLLRADEHANDLVELGVAFATNRRAKVVSTAARLFVATIAREPFAAGVVNLGVDLVVGQWLSRLDDRAVAHLQEGSSAADVARTLEPYFQHGADCARKTVAEPGHHAKTTMAHALQTYGRPGASAHTLPATQVQALLRAEEHASELSELADAFVSNRRAKVVSMAARLFVSAIVAEPLAPAVVNLGLDVVFGKHLSRLDDEAVEQMKDHAGAARTLKPYFQQARDSACKTVDEPGDNPALTMALHLEAESGRDEAIHNPLRAASTDTELQDLPLPDVDSAHAPSDHQAELRASASVARERLRRQLSRA
jgi:hypothetical protein